MIFRLKSMLIIVLFTTAALVASADHIAGKALYTNSELLPKNAKFEVQLSNISLMDIAAEVIGMQSIEPAGQIPIAFKIEFDDSQIKLGQRYAVSAKITDNGKLLYISDTMNPVFVGNDNQNLNIVMKRIGKIPETRTMEGMYKYMADAAVFKDCITGKYYPVAFEEESVALEKAYLEEVNGSNFFVKVALKGKIVQRPKMEGKSTEETLIVEKFIDILGLKDCTEHQADVPMTNNYWKLLKLYGKKVQVTSGEREAHILLRKGFDGAGELKVVSGCATIIGNYHIEENTVTFRANSIEKEWPDCKNTGMHKTFLAALDSASYWKIEGENLKIYDEMDNILAAFEAIYF